MGPEMLLAGSENQFDDQGKLKEEMAQKLLDTLMENLRALT